MARLDIVARGNLTPEQQKVVDDVTSGPRGGVRGPVPAWLASPGLADRAQKLGEFCRFNTTLPNDIGEIAILITAQHWQAQYEWYAHAKLARKAGVKDSVIEALHAGRRPEGLNEKEAIVYDVCTQSYRDKRIQDATYKRAVELLSEKTLVELIGLIGYYSLVSLTLNAFELLPPPGEEPFK